MGQIQIVTDSSCDVPPEIQKELNITVVPMNIHFGTETFQEGVTMTATEFYARLIRDGTSILPKTSQPSPGAFRETFQRVAHDSRDIIALHVSSALSGTYNAALTVAREMNEAREAHITVIDSRNASMCLGWMVIAAAEAAQRGESYADILNLVLDMIPRLHIPSMLETLEYVRAGGRIGKAQAFLGTILNIKPILGIEGGEVIPIEKVRTRGKAMERLVDITRHYMPFEDIAVMHTASPEAANEVVNLLAPHHPRERIIIAQTCAAIGAHVGPGAIGVCVVSQK
ncbi:MAG: DegV family protein [Chloroflexi bacterium]|nr:DegV family protein [Chloroflexota bacterium]